MSSWHYNGRYIDSSAALRTTDQCMVLPLLKKPNGDPFDAPLATLKKVHERNNLIVCEIDNVLRKAECEQIVETTEAQTFQNMSKKYNPEKQRNNDRLLVMDEALAVCLWNRTEPLIDKFIKDHDIPIRPLGFDVLRGNWEMNGLNTALRINKYSSDRNEFFAPHMDAQYCPSGDERSFFSLVLYLNDGFEGGETCFYFPKDNSIQNKELTVEEEIKAHGGLEEGFEQIKVIPRTGSVVLFSQNILHESVPLLQKEHECKYILKTDIMLRRKEKPFGFAVSEKEKEDYFQCLNYFREAQQAELSHKSDEAGELYERALSIRYSYPNALQPVKSYPADTGCKAIGEILPAMVWENIFSHLNGQDSEHLVYAFPDLTPIKKLQEQRFAPKFNTKHDNNRPKFFPKVGRHHGIYTRFEFPDADFFKKNEEGCCRVAAMYSFFLLGHDQSDEMYTVRFNPDTQEVCALPLEKLLSDAFHSEPCYGSVYKVRKNNTKDVNPVEDFHASVDRRYMALKHNAEFIGVDLVDKFHVKTTVYPEKLEDCYCCSGSEDNDDESDSDDDKDSDEKKDTRDKDEKEKGVISDAIHIHIAGDPSCSLDVENETLLCVMDKIGFFRGLDLEERGLGYDELWNDTMNKLQYSLDGRHGSMSEEPDEMVDETPIKDQYLSKLLERSKQRGCVSTALVAVLEKPINNVEVSDVCFCCIGGPGGDGCKDFSNSCKTLPYNHLVFDFQENQLTVERMKDRFVFDPQENHLTVERIKSDYNSSGCSTCFLEQVLKNHVEEELRGKYRNALVFGDMMHFVVKIEALAEKFVPFNHASCQCAFPNFDVNEYFSLRDYPYLNHIHLITQEYENGMNVWSVYGGIVAL